MQWQNDDFQKNMNQNQSQSQSQAQSQPPEQPQQTYQPPQQAAQTRPINYNEERMKRFWRYHGKKTIIIGAIFILALILLSESLFIVGESEQAFVSRFGVIKRLVLNADNTFHDDYASQLADEITLSDSVSRTSTSGLQFKVPFIDKVEKFSSRLYTYVSDSEVVNTLEKKQYYITTYAQWRITDPALFSLKLGSMNAARNQLDNLIHPVIVQTVNRMIADDFVSNKDALNNALQEGLRTINQDMCVRGIEVVDIQVHRTILPSANLETTYNRMRADRAKVAQQLRSEGDEEYNKAVAAADLEARKMQADAVAQAGQIRGEGDAQAAEIYANSYSVDPDFYYFWRSLQALEEALGTNSTLVLDENSPLFAELVKHIAP